jgi:hypothetical protein
VGPVTGGILADIHFNNVGKRVVDWSPYGIELEPSNYWVISDPGHSSLAEKPEIGELQPNPRMTPTRRQQLDQANEGARENMGDTPDIKNEARKEGWTPGGDHPANWVSRETYAHYVSSALADLGSDDRLTEKEKNYVWIGREENPRLNGRQLSDYERGVREREAEQAKRTRYGVFVWEAANMYRPASALKLFKRAKLAHQHIERTAKPDDNWVVRSFEVRDE